MGTQVTSVEEERAPQCLHGSATFSLILPSLWTDPWLAPQIFTWQLRVSLPLPAVSVGNPEKPKHMCTRYEHCCGLVLTMGPTGPSPPAGLRGVRTTGSGSHGATCTGSRDTFWSVLCLLLFPYPNSSTTNLNKARLLPSFTCVSPRCRLLLTFFLLLSRCPMPTSSFPLRPLHGQQPLSPATIDFSFKNSPCSPTPILIYF